MKILKPRKNANPWRRVVRALPNLTKAINEANLAMAVYLSSHGIENPTARYFRLVEDRKQLRRVMRNSAPIL